MSDKDSTPKKREIPGRRAFSAGYGLGSLITLVTIGSIVGVVRLGIPDSGSGESASPPNGEREVSAPSVAPELVDGIAEVCGRLDEEAELFSGPRTQRVPPEDSAVDSATASPGAQPRTVEDRCEWAVHRQDERFGAVALEYTAFLGGSAGESKEAAAEELFREKKLDARVESEEVLEVFTSPEGSGSLDKSYAVFTEPSAGVLRYSFVGMQQSAAFVVEVEADKADGSDGPLEEGGPVEQMNEIKLAVRDIVDPVGSDFGRMIPD
ncbi:hypothetical protein F4561_000641 [Lipingzhangella halophila]|uniref:DUF3558 domain-containing protein n=1 Tax=Lipingzhangella halophila TaxID=1783352 RepID=A0A7W7W0N9_9ACTN|nr:hypothetical protein [Lipingzhangella halophila]MBB4929821.1 hypothetical protein [Lipingzhangella halophila]